ncbi:(Lyso)-N-acylphosphatidylethanolamine lipase-like isoform X2 [Lineus longissimus]|uniref:(Lyso)-N-acylphosphatidylethanolamine lipase-like isoform X2 n=1 Tax=Lineus longissimus TaxID=88925 RepID=UPI00315CF300
MADAVDEGGGGWFSWLRWRPTSTVSLAQAEQKLLKGLKSVLSSKYVWIAGNKKRIWTVWTNPNNTDKTPVVFVHGMGGGVGLWALNIDGVAEQRPFYAFDLLGFGRSSRAEFSQDAVLAEKDFVESIEDWRKEMGLERFVLLGHSLGGYLASSYSLRYPQYVKHLILVDPWGFPERVQDPERLYRIPIWARTVAALLQPFNPLAVVRFAGPWGPGLVQRFRPDFKKKYSGFVEDDSIIFDYIYHCNAQYPSGETAFKTMSIPFGWARNPMIHRVKEIDRSIPMTIVYGSRSWVDNSTGNLVKFLREDAHVDVQLIKGAGHHVYADRAEAFNSLVNKVCDSVDERNDRGEKNSDETAS